MNKMRKLIVIVIILIITGAGTGIWFAARSPEKYRGSVKRVRLGVNPEDISSLILIAENKGYFIDNNLDVTFKEYEAGPIAINALTSGKVDIATAAEFVMVNKSFNHDDLRVIAMIAKGDKISIIGRKDRGIERPSQLKGKRIGIKRGSNAEFFLGRFLSSNGLTLKEIVAIDVLPSEMKGSLENSDIDAVVIWDPIAYEIKDSMGTGAVSWSTQVGEETLWLLITRESFIDEHPAVVEKFLRAMVDAENFVESREMEAKKIVAERLQLDKIYLDSTWVKCTFSVTLEQQLLLVMEEQARWMIDNRLTGRTAVPNYLNFIYSDALEVVKPKSVTIIR